MTLAKKLSIRNILITFAALIMLTAAIIPIVNYYNTRQSRDDIKRMLAIYETWIASADYAADEVSRKEVFAGMVELNTDILENTRVTVLSSDGTVIYAETSSSTEAQYSREEIEEAIASGEGYAVRESQSFPDMTMIYYAKKAAYGEDEVIVRVAVSYESLTAYLIPVITLMSLIALLAGFLYAAVSTKVSKGYTLMLNGITGQLEEVERGIYRRKYPSTEYEDVNALIYEINKISEKISDTISELQTERNTLNTVLGNMQQGIIAVDSEGVIALINGEAEDILKCRATAGKNLYYATQEEVIIKAVTEALNSGAGAVFELSQENKVYSVNVSPYSDHLGAKKCLIVLTDITIRKDLEKMRSEFFSNASHELKTPLTAIKGFSELIESDAANTAKYNGMIMQNTTRMLSLIDDMLYLVKIEERAPEETENVDLRRIAENCIETLKPEIVAKGITAVVKGGGELEASPEKMTQLIMNLCSNAVRYNKQGGSIAVNIEENPRKIIITVKDTGIGIPGEHIGRIFERFYRVDRSRSKKLGGTGLGLAIVKNIASAYSGEVSLKSVKGEGSEFKVVLSRH